VAVAVVMAVVVSVSVAMAVLITMTVLCALERVYIEANGASCMLNRNMRWPRALCIALEAAGEGVVDQYL
jgi:hypothetical protein